MLHVLHVLHAPHAHPIHAPHASVLLLRLRELLHELPHHLLRLRHLLLLLSEPMLLHARLRILGVLPRGVCCLLSSRHVQPYTYF